MTAKSEEDMVAEVSGSMTAVVAKWQTIQAQRFLYASHTHMATQDNRC